MLVIEQLGQKGCLAHTEIGPDQQRLRRIRVGGPGAHLRQQPAATHEPLASLLAIRPKVPGAAGPAPVATAAWNPQLAIPLGLFRPGFPFPEQGFRVGGRVVVDQIGAELTEPHPVVGRLALSARERRVVAGASRSRGGDVGRHAGVIHLIGIGVGAGGVVLAGRA